MKTRFIQENAYVENAAQDEFKFARKSNSASNRTLMTIQCVVVVIISSDDMMSKTRDVVLEDDARNRTLDVVCAEVMTDKTRDIVRADFMMGRASDVVRAEHMMGTTRDVARADDMTGKAHVEVPQKTRGSHSPMRPTVKRQTFTFKPPTNIIQAGDPFAPNVS